jgi:multiple sugar transport system substrate-binding protein
MAMNFFAFFPALANPDVNPYAESTGFFANPTGPYGDRGAALGGQGITVINYISDDRKQASLDFIEWFAQEDIQLEWAALGGYTCNANVLESDTFLNATPFNPAFAETMTIVKDFWNVPVYDPLLQSANREFGAFVVEGQGTAQEAMDAIADEHTTILQEAGILP